MENYDAIIIGAGLAGLTAGAKLSREGKKILMIEHHHTVGGCATTFNRQNKYQFEVGLHEMDGLGNENDPKIKIFNELNVFDNVKFIRVPEFYRLLHGSLDFIMPDGLENAINSLTNQFPKDTDNIKDFFKEMKNIQAFKKTTLFKRYKMTVGEVLDEFFTDNNIKIILCANLVYYHDDPYQLSFIYYSHAQLSYLEGGGWYIKGGSLKLSLYLSDYITNNNGNIILKHEVIKILLDDKKKTAIGVSFQRAKRKEPEIQTEFANIIISNAAIPTITDKLIPSLKNTKFEESINSQTLPCSLLSIYVAFSDHNFQNDCYSTFVLDENVKTLKEIYEIEKENNYHKKGFVFVDYGLLGEPLTGAICSIDYLKNWVNLDKKVYRKKKQEVTDIFIDRLEGKIPGIKEKIVYSEMATPKTISRYTKNPLGVVYGYTQTPDMIGRKRLELTTPPIKNLYFASAWGSPGGGFSGAISAGYKTATMLLNKNLI